MSLRVRLLFKFPHYQVLAISIILSLVGISEIVLAVVGFLQRIWGHGIGAGVWSGVVAFTAGITGIIAVNTKGVFTVRLFFLVSALSFTTALPLMALSAGGLDFNSGFYGNVPFSKGTYSPTKLIHGFLFALSVMQLILSALTSLVCFKHLCWNERAIRKQHSRGIDRLHSSENHRNMSGRSSTSSHAPLVSGHSSRRGKRSKRKHHRRSHSNRSSENTSDNFVEAFAERRSRNNRGRTRNSTFRRRENGQESTDVTISMAPTQFSSVSRNLCTYSEAEGNSLSVQPSVSVHPSAFNSDNNAANTYSVSELDEFHFHHPIPIEEDEELPPYEENVILSNDEADEDSVIPRSVSDNSLDVDSESLNSESSDQSEEDDVDVEVWDSVSQRDEPYIISSQRSCVSESLPNSTTVDLPCVSSNSNAELQSPEDLQGVSYREFVRKSDQINSGKNIPQRSQSFQNEREFAREKPQYRSRHTSTEDSNAMNIQSIALVQNEVPQPNRHAPPKPPRSLSDEASASNENHSSTQSDNSTENGKQHELNVITEQFKALCTSLEQATNARQQSQIKTPPSTVEPVDLNVQYASSNDGLVTASRTNNIPLSANIKKPSNNKRDIPVLCSLSGNQTASVKLPTFRHLTNVSRHREYKNPEDEQNDQCKPSSSLSVFEAITPISKTFNILDRQSLGDDARQTIPTSAVGAKPKLRIPELRTPVLPIAKSDTFGDKKDKKSLALPSPVNEYATCSFTPDTSNSRSDNAKDTLGSSNPPLLLDQDMHSSGFTAAKGSSISNTRENNMATKSSSSEESVNNGINPSMPTGPPIVNVQPNLPVLPGDVPTRQTAMYSMVL